MTLTDDDHRAIHRLLAARWRGLAVRAMLEKSGRGEWQLSSVQLSAGLRAVPELVRAWVFAGLHVDELPASLTIFKGRLLTAWGARIIDRVQSRGEGLGAVADDESSMELCEGTEIKSQGDIEESLYAKKYH